MVYLHACIKLNQTISLLSAIYFRYAVETARCSEQVCPSDHKETASFFSQHPQQLEQVSVSLAQHQIIRDLASSLCFTNS